MLPLGKIADTSSYLRLQTKLVQARLFEHIVYSGKKIPEVLICEDSSEADKLHDLCCYLDIYSVTLPDFRANYLDDLRPFAQELSQINSALREYYSAKKKPLIISPIKTLFHKLPRANLLELKKISFGDKIEQNEFKNLLLQWGYRFVDLVQMEGEVSFRGDIIDLFVTGQKHPFRVSLFDEDVEQICYFDLQTQLKLDGELESFELSSASFSLDLKMYDKLQQEVEDSTSDSFVKDIASLGFWYLGDSSVDLLQECSALFVKDLSGVIDDSYAIDRVELVKDRFDSIETICEPSRVKPLLPTDINTLFELHKNLHKTVIVSSDAQLRQYDLFNRDGFKIKRGSEIVNLISTKELIVSLNRAVVKRRQRRTSLLVDDLKPGDYVVHEDHGVGIFDGIEKVNILGGVRDFIALSYQGGDRVLLPVENLDHIDRYIAASGAPPILDRLGKASFAKLKDRVKKRLFEIASEIVERAAQRALLKAPILKIPRDELNDFIADAGFEYTQDQKKSVEQIEQQMQSSKVMDKLLSGDVGFGKTEVAMCAMYIAAKSGYQSAIIVPTTLLSSQHYASLADRFRSRGIKVARLDRFVSSKERRSIEGALADGSIDIVVGTHALFGKKFASLGVVVIDEEHKFGVKQKEKLKELYDKTHLLSMSATPIPRSLNQALSSIKSLSSLLTPPLERKGVRTFVKAYDESMLKEVILRELRRGGQLFYVYNSIKHMPIKMGELQALLPSLRILMLHSQVGAVESEKGLLKFMSGEYDLLLATSIISSGIHMPKVNTMIVDGADRFGMADLHQLRGRVGRGVVEGFAYFIVQDKESISDEAKKRLLALESNSFLGSGSVLAYHDLEIRGGGNLIGDAQSGHIKNIGYSLYLRMLEDAIKELTNTQEIKKEKVDIKLSINAYISHEVVNEDRLRLELYRRLSQCEDIKSIYEIEEEIEQRFGALDTPTKQFLELVSIKLLALDKGIKSISNYAQNITLTYSSAQKITIKSQSRDDDDVIKEVLLYLRSKKNPL